MKTKFTRGSENKIYMAIVIIVSFSFIVFFSSKFWLSDDSRVLQSPIGKDIEGLESTTLVLNKWEYSPKKQLMELSLQTKQNDSEVFKPTYSFKAQDEETSTYYPINIVFKDENSVVLQVRNVPEDYKNVYVIVQENKNKSLMAQEDMEDITETGPSTKVLVGDYRKIEKNNNIVKKDKMDYEKDQIAIEMNNIKSEMNRIQKEQIPYQNKVIVAVQDNIVSLKNDLKYQTKNEKQDTLMNIQDRKNNIEDAKNKIEEYKITLKELQEKYDKLNQKVQDIVSQKEQNEKSTKRKLTKNNTSVEGNTSDSDES